MGSIDLMIPFFYNLPLDVKSGTMKKPKENISIKLFSTIFIIVTLSYYFLPSGIIFPFCFILLHLMFLSSVTIHIVCDTLPHHFDSYKNSCPDSIYIMEKGQIILFHFRKNLTWVQYSFLILI